MKLITITLIQEKKGGKEIISRFYDQIVAQSDKFLEFIRITWTQQKSF